MSAFYAKETLNSEYMNDVMTSLKSYNSILMLLLVPVFALTTKLAFRKWGNNYYEHLVMNAYIVCVYTLCSIMIISPLLYLFKNNMNYFTVISSLTMLSVPFILIWFFKGFYPDKSIKSIVGQVLLTFCFLMVLFILLTLLSVIGGFVYATIAGPEALQYFRSK
jgi:glycopeptide antibiotics resistance protein